MRAIIVLLFSLAVDAMILEIVTTYAYNKIREQNFGYSLEKRAVRAMMYRDFWMLPASSMVIYVIKLIMQ